MYLTGDDLIVTILAFGAALWLCFRIFTGEDNLVAVVIGALLFAIFGQSLILYITSNVIVAIAIIAMMILVSQYFTEMSLTEATMVFVIAWIVGLAIIQWV